MSEEWGVMAKELNELFSSIPRLPQSQRTKAMMDWAKQLVSKLGQATLTQKSHVLPMSVMAARQLAGMVDSSMALDFSMAMGRSLACLESFGENGIPLFGPIDEITANVCIYQLLHVDKKASTDYITLVIDSLGGEVEQSIRLIDFMCKDIKRPIRTWSLRSFSAASLIAIHGDWRVAQPRGDQAVEMNRPLMIHQMWDVRGKANTTGILRHCKEHMQLHRKFNDKYVERLAADFDLLALTKDRFITAGDALHENMIDEIV